MHKIFLEVLGAFPEVFLRVLAGMALSEPVVFNQVYSPVHSPVALQWTRGRGGRGRERGVM